MVMLGIDCIEQYDSLFTGKRIGLITNPTGVDSKMKSTIDIIFERYNLTALFSPEHGVRGNIQAGEKVAEYKDEKTGVSVYTLYGETKKPTKEMMAHIDIMVIDIQDIGSRLYTYLYTMAYCMSACKENDKQFVVLDRPNPIGLTQVEGGTIEPTFTSFVGLYPIAYRHGMTMGELALLFNTEYHIDCNLNVIKNQNYKREMDYSDTGLSWIMPSPNMPTLDTAYAYNATCIFEGTNISEGRGTTRPFEMVGAPFLDSVTLARRLNGLGLDGVYFRETSFTPTFSKHKDELCHGVQIHIMDKNTFLPVKTAIYMLYEISQLAKKQFAYTPAYSKNGKPMMDYNTGSDIIRTTEYDPNDLYHTWCKECENFKEIRKKYLLY